MADLIDMMVMELDGRELLATSTNAEAIERARDMLPKLETEIETAIRRYGFTDIPAIKDRLQLPVQRVFRARQAAFEHVVQLAREHETEMHL